MDMMNKSASKQTPPTDSRPPMVMPELPSMPTLLGKAAFKSGSYEIGDALPGLSTQVNDLIINAQHLAAYKKLCGFKAQGDLPATYLHMLVFPLFLQILTQQDFPIKAMGQVHLRNQISVLESFDIQRPLSITAAVGGSILTSRGLEWDIDVSAAIDNQTVWTSNSTFLHRCKTDVKQKRRPVISREGEPQSWAVDTDIGRRYARISGDYNPIHLSDITAKLFGFKQAIAHGMWSKARCLAALEEELPDAGYSVDVNFHRPLFLPSGVLFYTKQLVGKKRFSLYNERGDQAHLDGLIS